MNNVRSFIEDIFIAHLPDIPGIQRVSIETDDLHIHSRLRCSVAGSMNPWSSSLQSECVPTNPSLATSLMCQVLSRHDQQTSSNRSGQAECALSWRSCRQGQSLRTRETGQCKAKVGWNPRRRRPLSNDTSARVPWRCGSNRPRPGMRVQDCPRGMIPGPL